jgi:signal transduction histidine kinase
MEETQANILVIDDEPGIREGCRRVLEAHDFAVDTAGTLWEGQQKVETGYYDLVLLDVMMPNGRGMDLLRPIHSRDAETIVIIITGYATIELAVEAIKSGAYNLISKPFTSDILLMAVNQGLEKRRLSLETQRLQWIEKEAEELASAKVKAERLGQFKSQFTYLVAHELRAPIGGAQSQLRTLTRGLVGELTPQQREILDRVEVRLDQLLALVNDLLVLAASKTVTPNEPLVPVMLRPVLQGVMDQFSVEAEQKNIALICNPLPETISVWATQEGLTRVLSNLIGNAIKYTPADGSVSIGLTAQPDTITLTITDTGIGIPADDLPHIWEEFHRAQNAHALRTIGTGLGLSIVKSLVDTFKGSIDVDSAEGKGTTFSLTLVTSSQEPVTADGSQKP